MTRAPCTEPSSFEWDLTQLKICSYKDEKRQPVIEFPNTSSAILAIIQSKSRDKFSSGSSYEMAPTREDCQRGIIAKLKR